MLTNNLIISGFMMTMRAFPPLSALFSSIILVPKMGADYGYVAYAMSAFMLAANPLGSAMGRLVLREVTIASEKKNLGRKDEVIKWASKNSIFFFFCLILALIPFTFAVDWPLFNSFDPVHVCLFAAAFLGYLAVNIETALLRARGRDELGIFYLNFLPWFLYLFGIIFLSFTKEVNFESIALIFIVSWVGLGSLLFVMRCLSFSAKPTKHALAIQKNGNDLWMPLWFLAANTFLQFGIKSLSIFYVEYVINIESVVILSVAMQLASVAAFVHSTTIMQGLPLFAKLSARDDRGVLQKKIRSYARYAFGFSIASLVFFYFFGELTLKFIYGGVVDDAYNLTLVFLLAQTVSCFVGPAGPLLNMSRNSNEVLKASITSFVASACIIVLAVNFFGLMGVGIGFLFLSMLNNFLLKIACARCLGVRCSPF